MSSNIKNKDINKKYKFKKVNKPTKLDNQLKRSERKEIKNEQKSDENGKLVGGSLLIDNNEDNIRENEKNNYITGGVIIEYI